MTNKEYRCQNGDLITIGKRYKNRFIPTGAVVVGFDDGLIVAKDDDRNYQRYDAAHFESLWQPEEQPDADGWIKHTTGKQPVADDVRVEVKWVDDDVTMYPAKVICWDNSKLSHYRIVEDEQEEFNEDDKKVIENIKGRFEQEFRDKIQAEKDKQTALINKIINQRKIDHLIDVFGVWLDPQEISGVTDWANKYAFEYLGVNQLKDATVKQLDKLRDDILNNRNASYSFSCNVFFKNSYNVITIELRTANEVINEIKRQLGDC